MKTSHSRISFKYAVAVLFVLVVGLTLAIFFATVECFEKLVNDFGATLGDAGDKISQAYVASMFCLLMFVAASKSDGKNVTKARRAAGVGRPDQYFFVLAESATAQVVKMKNEGLEGTFNR